MSPLSPVPDGSVGSADGHAAASQLCVLGYALDVDTAGLRAMAATMRAAGGRVRAALTTMRHASAVLAATTSLAPATGAGASGRVWEATAVGADLVSRIEELASSLERVADDYEETERQAALTVAVAPRRPPVPLPALPVGVPHRLLGLVGSVLGEAFRRGQLTPTDRGMGLLLEEWAWTITGGDLYPAFLPHADDPVQRLGLGLALPLTYVHGVSRTARVRPVHPPGAAPLPGGLTTTGPPAAGVADLVARMYPLYPRFGGAPGSIRVDRVRGPGGAVSWQVVLPGTQSSLASGTNLSSANPNDWGSNLQAFAGLGTAVEAGVVQALRMAGARPGEPIVLAGHSQGAMTALRLANDPAVREHLTITSVVTIGGPVGHIPTPDGVAVLTIEHRDDLVVGVENEPNPVEYGRTTVVRDVSLSPDRADAGVTDVRQAHDVPAYLRTAAMVDASRDPAVLDWFDRTGPAFGTHGSTSTAMYFQIVRER